MKKGGRSAVKELLLELAEAVQHAVAELVEDPAEVVGRGADGAPSTRIDRVAEAAVLRVLEYEEARLNVLSEEAGFIDRGGDATLVLDPIDGTHNALRGVPAYSVSMAVGRSHLADIEEGLVRDLVRSEEHTSELQSPYDLVCRLLLEKKKKNKKIKNNEYKYKQ